MLACIRSLLRSVAFLLRGTLGRAGRRGVGRGYRSRVIPWEDRGTVVLSRTTLRQTPGCTRPDSYASTTACARSRRPSFWSTRPTWVFTVVSATKSSRAISWFDKPRAMHTSTSRSRSVSSSSAAGGGGGSGRRANSSTSLRVTEGASSASPAATTRTAATNSSGGRSFSRNPLAPARSAR